MEQQSQWSELERDFTVSQRTFYKKVSRLCQGAPHAAVPAHMTAPDGKATQTEEESRQAWAQHFGGMGTENKFDPRFDGNFYDEVSERARQAASTGAGSRARQSTTLGWDITAKEVERAIKALPSGKASGPDGIVNELLRWGGPIMRAALLDLFRVVWEEQRVPTKRNGQLPRHRTHVGGGEAV